MSTTDQIIAALKEQEGEENFSWEDVLAPWENDFIFVERNFNGENRWGMLWENIIGVPEENTFICFETDEGKTEYQDHTEVTDAYLVEKKEKVVWEWVPLK